MADDRKAADGFSLRRWSQRKLAATREARAAAVEQAAPVEPRERHDDPSRDASAPPIATATPLASDRSHAAAQIAPRGDSPGVASDLPPIDSLTIDSDFSAFMQPGVDESLRRSALRKLLRDPRFNVMDGLDVYIDDYSKPSPIEPDVVRGLIQARYLFGPPNTRRNAEGVVEDRTDDVPAATEDAAPPVSPADDGRDAIAQIDDRADTIAEALPVKAQEIIPKEAKP